MHYPDQMTAAKLYLAEGNTGRAEDALLSSLRSSRDRLLHDLELGMVYYLEGDYRRCIKTWREAEKTIEGFDRRPVINLRGIGEQIGTLALNDYLITYRGMAYERALLHTYLALAYLMTSDHEEARVELKKAEAAQSEGLARWEEERDALFKDSYQARHIEDDLFQFYQSRYGATNNYASAGVNPLVYYLSGWLYRKEGSPDEALIDYKRIAGLGVNQAFLVNDIEELVSSLENKALKPASEARRNTTGEVLIVYHQGLVPSLEEIRVPFVLQNSWVMLAIPVYADRIFPSATLRIKSGADEVTTNEIVNVFSLAKGALQERIPGIAIRQVARIAFKSTLSHKVSKEAGALASVVSDIYNIVSERADLRSWLTIPFTIQVGRMRLPPGRHVINLDLTGSGGQTQVEIEIKAGECKVLDVHSLGSRIVAKVS